MERARDLDDYVARPFGRWFGESTFVHFFAEPTLCGTLFFGRPSEAEVARLVRAIATELPSRSPVHRAFVDATHLEGVDPAAFRALAAYVGPRAAELGRNVDAHAVVHGGGAIGAMVAGFYDVTPAAAPERTRYFTDVNEALEHLGVRPTRAFARRLEAIRAEASRDDVTALRAWLRAHPRDASSNTAASALGLGPRSLRDRLRAAGTSFRREHVRARVELAKEELLRSDDKLTAIAIDLGFASLSHFTTLFRREVGITPSAWRARGTDAETRPRARGTRR